jgi:hypothetical protein
LTYAKALKLLRDHHGVRMMFWIVGLLALATSLESSLYAGRYARHHADVFRHGYWLRLFLIGNLMAQALALCGKPNGSQRPTHLFGNPYGAVVTWQPAVPFSGARLERELFYRGCMFPQKLGRPNERFMGYVERTGANLSATGC